ncbi:MAG: DNA polymerase I [Coriobacteriia bacterium]
MTKRIIAVVDGNSLMHRAFHALPPTMTAPDGRPTNAAYGFIAMLLKLVADLEPDGVIVAFDCGKPVFRIQALEQYKVQRPPTDPGLKEQFPMVRELLGGLNVPIVELEGWEGDDILGTLAVRGKEAGAQVLLVTGDRDAFQLVNDDVKVVTTKKGITDIVVYGPDEVYERYGVTPAQVPDYLGLKGDTSDNIPGVPGIGEKTAAKLLQQYGSLDELLARADEVPGKVGQNLKEHEGAARASRTVATIVCDVPLDLDIVAAAFGDFDPHAVATVFGKYRFTSLLERALALKGSRSAKGSEVASPEEASTATAAGGAASGQAAHPVFRRAILRGADARSAVGSWLHEQRDGDGWLGVVVDEGGASGALFGDARQLGVASADAVALGEGADAEGLLGELVDASAHVAAPDLKGLLQVLCPADETQPCPGSIDAIDSRNLFDLGVAAYLLESNRSSYELPSLYADYLGDVFPEPDDRWPRAALAASASVDLAPELEQRLTADGSLGVMRDIEMPLVPVLVRMERAGVGLDPGVLRALSTSAADEIQTLTSEICELAGYIFTIDSPKQLSEVLFEKLGLPPQRKTKTGYSTDASVLATLVPLHPIAEKVVAYRELTKLKSTYLDALPRMVGGDGRLHTSFNQTVAATGRLSSSNPNLQNIPVRTELGRRIRAAFVPARPGDLIVSADYSQIELRILAHLSGDEGLIAAFTSGQDFHQATAGRVFGVAPEEVTPGMRAKAKAVNFGIVYGQSAHGLAETLKIPRAEAQAMIDRYYGAYPRVRSFLDETVAEAHQNGWATTIFGRKRRIPELASSNYNLRSFGERTAMNHPMQGTAADIIKLAMIEVDRRLREDSFASAMVLQVHDELVFESPADEVERLSAMVAEAMAGVVKLAVPLEVSVASGPDWASAK